MELFIESVAFGGEGVGKKDGLVYFIPFTLPGEEIEATIHTKKKNFARGSLLKLIKPSPERIFPPCPYFSHCGGCQLQQASYPEQLHIKQRFVEDSLKRIGKISFPVPPVVPSKEKFGYRRHISLQLVYTSCWQLCFSAEDGSPLPINSCLLFEEESELLALLQIKLAELPEESSFEGRVKLIKQNSNYTVAAVLENSLSAEEELNLSEAFLSAASELYLKTPEKTLHIGNHSLSFSCNDLLFNFSPFGFVQNHAEQSKNIYELTCKLLAAQEKILDLYCGIGVSTLLLAKEHKKVLGIEVSSESIVCAKENAKINNLTNVEFIASSVETCLPDMLSSFLPDAILVNPPKNGLDPSVTKLLGFASVSQIVYISCYPPTLARDLALLDSLGFAVDFLQSFDMFPQTTHVETVVSLQRKKQALLPL